MSRLRRLDAKDGLDTRRRSSGRTDEVAESDLGNVRPEAFSIRAPKAAARDATGSRTDA